MSISREVRAQVETFLSELSNAYGKAIAAYEMALRIPAAESRKANLARHLERLRKHVIEVRIHADSLNLPRPSETSLATIMASAAVAVGSVMGEEAVTQGLCETEDEVTRLLEASSPHCNASVGLNAAVERQLDDARQRRRWLHAARMGQDVGTAAEEKAEAHGRASHGVDTGARAPAQTTSG